MTILMLTALVLAMAIDPLIDAELSPLIGPLMWALGVFIPIRLLLNVRRLRSKAAAPVLASASVQSRLFGFAPGTSTFENPGAVPYTTTEIEDDPQRNRPDGLQ